MSISIKNHEQIALMRKANRIVAETHALLEKHMKSGVTTAELNRMADEFIRSKDAIPSFLGVPSMIEGGIPYPGAVCISINEEVIHGIPGLKKLKDGDIVSVDIGAEYKGFNGDAARTHAVGETSPERLRLIEVTRNSFFEGIRHARQNAHLRDISGAIQDYVENNGFSVVREFTGHGIGREMHEAPEIPNFRTKSRGPRLFPGMTLAIEPMVNMGTYDVEILSDDWTVVTRDGKCSAHYENTILITDGEPEILSIC
ncbi:MAG: type I methionyl aminopeptidase [Defluviitaleaceae bacterium]|nr:type I methionyl aminopeptidase [Defluviitaleaceae bacterium]